MGAAEGGHRQQLLANRIFAVSLNLHTKPAAWLGHAVFLLPEELFIPRGEGGGVSAAGLLCVPCWEGLR